MHIEQNKNFNSDQKKILVIGDIMLDIYFSGEVSRISPEAPVPVFRKKHEEYALGGAANVAANLVAAGQAVSILALVGSDENGEKMKNLFLQKGIDISFIKTIEKATITKTRFLAENNQQLLRLDVEDVSEIEESLCQELLAELEHAIDDFDLIILSDYLKGLLSYHFTQGVIALAKKHRIRVLVDVKGSDYEKYKGAFLLKPNLKELNDLTQMPVSNKENIVRAATYLLNASDCEYILTTCGAKGMLLVGKDYVHNLETMGKAVYDVTGAGDTTIAYLAVGLAGGMEMEAAMEMANYAAGIQVGKVGTSSVYIQEVREAMSGQNASYLKKKLRWRNLDDFTQIHRGQKIVFTNGCFDILHVGHKRYLEEAKALGDILVVGVNSDASVKRLKGPERPVNGEQDRIELLAGLDCVDYVIVFEDDTPYDLIRRIQPDLLVKGGDYKPQDVVGKDIVEAHGGQVVILPFVDGKSTTDIISKIKK